MQKIHYRMDRDLQWIIKKKKPGEDLCQTIFHRTVVVASLWCHVDAKYKQTGVFSAQLYTVSQQAVLHDVSGIQLFAEN